MNITTQFFEHYQKKHDTLVLSHDTLALSHDTPSLSRDTPTLSHNTPSLSHDTLTLSHDTPTLSHDTPTSSHDTTQNKNGDDTPSVSPPFFILKADKIYPKVLKSLTKPAMPPAFMLASNRLASPKVVN